MKGCFMHNALKFIVLGSFLAAGSPLLADDSPSAPPVQTPKQKMQDCMNRHRAANAGMSEPDMRKACSKELQTLDNHPSLPASPALVPAKG